YYRRRRRNVARKAGNIADFCRRWGGAYDYLLMLDADSLMEPATILELARRMEADPDAGLIQTVPRLVHGKTLLARLHQFAVRDRRWCQGNLQHARIVPAAGLHWVSRFHLLTGIFSYVASLLWLLLIIVGLALAVQARFTPPDYFQEPYQLFPTWPQVDPELELQLLGFTALLLLGPKIIGLLTMLRDTNARQQSGGALRLTASFLFEVILSALIAPVMMMIQ